MPTISEARFNKAIKLYCHTHVVYICPEVRLHMLAIWETARAYGREELLREQLRVAKQEDKKQKENNDEKAI